MRRAAAARRGARGGQDVVQDAQAVREPRGEAQSGRRSAARSAFGALGRQRGEEAARQLHEERRPARPARPRSRAREARGSSGDAFHRGPRGAARPGSRRATPRVFHVKRRGRRQSRGVGRLAGHDPALDRLEPDRRTPAAPQARSSASAEVGLADPRAGPVDEDDAVALIRAPPASRLDGDPALLDVRGGVGGGDRQAKAGRPVRDRRAAGSPARRGPRRRRPRRPEAPRAGSPTTQGTMWPSPAGVEPERAMPPGAAAAAARTRSPPLRLGARRGRGPGAPPPRRPG